MRPTNLQSEYIKDKQQQHDINLGYALDIKHGTCFSGDQRIKLRLDDSLTAASAFGKHS